MFEIIEYVAVSDQDKSKIDRIEPIFIINNHKYKYSDAKRFDNKVIEINNKILEARNKGENNISLCILCEYGNYYDKYIYDLYIEAGYNVLIEKMIDPNEPYINYIKDHKECVKHDYITKIQWV